MNISQDVPIAQVDELCNTLYSSSVQVQRAAASAALRTIFSCDESRARDEESVAVGGQLLSAHEVAAFPCWFPILIAAMSRSSSPFTHVFVASSLAQCVDTFWQRLSDDDCWSMRTELLNWLAHRASSIEPYVRTLVIGVVSRVTCLAWDADHRHRATLSECLQFIVPGADGGMPSLEWFAQAATGCELLERLVSDAQSSTTRTIAGMSLCHGFSEKVC
jgi:hypothetical protein